MRARRAGSPTVEPGGMGAPADDFALGDAGRDRRRGNGGGVHPGEDGLQLGPERGLFVGSEVHQRGADAAAR